MSGSEPFMAQDDMLAQPVGETAFPSAAGKSVEIEEQLAHIIRSSREVAVVAEELLREFSAEVVSESASQSRPIPHAIVVAPRLLSATLQQLDSLLAMMRTF